MLCRDVVDYRLPAGPCVAFLFNPFGAPIMRRMLAAWRSVRRGLEGAIDLLYVNNEQEHVLRRQPDFVRLFAGPIRRSAADAAADRHILTQQPDSEYAATGWEDCSIYRWTPGEGC
jgi:hypothetical protein